MKEQLFFGTMSSKGQVTLPAEARRALQIEPQDRLIFRLVGGKLEITPLPMTFEEAYASVPPLDPPLSDEEVSRIAYEDHIDALIRDGGI